MTDQCTYFSTLLLFEALFSFALLLLLPLKHPPIKAYVPFERLTRQTDRGSPRLASQGCSNGTLTSIRDESQNFAALRRFGICYRAHGHSRDSGPTVCHVQVGLQRFLALLQRLELFPHLKRRDIIEGSVPSELDPEDQQRQEEHPIRGKKLRECVICSSKGSIAGQKGRERLRAEKDSRYMARVDNRFNPGLKQ